MTPRFAQTLLWGALIGVLVLVGLATLQRGQGARLWGRAEVPRVAGQVAFGDYGAVPDFALTTQTGATFTSADLEGKIWVADFIFTHCAGICPRMTDAMALLGETLPMESAVRYLSFTVDPERDTVERLAEYADAYGADDERWIFLTGEKSFLRRLVTKGFKLGVQDSSPEDVAAGSEPILHSSRFVLIDQSGHIRGYYDGLDENALEQLRADIHRLHHGKST